MVRFFVEARSWDTLSPAKVLEQANAMLLGRLPRDTFVTAFLGILSRDSLSYCNAGHLPPLHVRAGTVCPLDSHGLPLGVLERHGYSESELLLDPGDLVFAHTDGLVEARRAGPCTAPSGWRSSWRDWHRTRRRSSCRPCTTT